jgi:hypothetical protein
MVAALRTLAAPAKRLAAALEGDASGVPCSAGLHLGCVGRHVGLLVKGDQPS